MIQYIDKAAVVAVIEKLKGKISESSSYRNGWQHALRMLELSLNTLEVKNVEEVPAEVQINSYGNKYISTWSGLKEYDNYQTGEQIKVLFQNDSIMTQYIEKEAAIAEIENRIKETKSMMQPKYDKFWAGQITAFKSVLKILDTLEVKEVDLEKEISRVSKNEYFDFTDWKSIARHFFELGLKARKGE